MKLAVIAFALSCEPRVVSDFPATVADACDTPYVAPAEGISLEVQMVNKLGADYRFYAICFQLDGRAVMYAHEPGAKRVVVTPGAHHVTAFAKWVSGSNAGLKFLVKTSHDIDARAASVLRVTFVEEGHGPLQERPKGQWLASESESDASAPEQDASPQ